MRERNPPQRNRHFRLLALFSLALSAFLFYLLRTPALPFKASWKRDLFSLPLRVDWQKHPRPTFCDSLKSFPQPKDPQCANRKGNVTCDRERPQFFSQDGEDYYLYTRHFSKLNRAGVYVDIAANDATDISNTYFMDRCLGWRGVCAEANAKYFEKLFRERSCLIVPTCVSDTDGNIVRFGMRSASGGIVDTYKGDSAMLESGSVETLRCTSLKSVFERTALRKIDYLSLDVEGHELLVLKGIDWSDIRINVITVELSSQNRKQIVSFLADRGFQRVDTAVHEVNGMKGFHMNDPVFVHQSQVFGRPT